MKYAPRRHHRNHFHLRLIAAVFLLVIAGAIAALSIYYVNDRPGVRIGPTTYRRGTSYDGISSRSSNVFDRGVHYVIEYPVAGVSAIDSTVASYIDQLRGSMAAPADGPYLGGDTGEFNASYLVRSANRDYISIVAQVNITYPMDVGVHDAAYWTFDRHTGQVISLEQLFGDRAADGVARTVLYIRQALGEQAAKRHERVDDAYLERVVTADTIRDFLVRDRSTIEFDFGQGTVAPESAGPVTVALSIDRLQLFLQNDQARRLLEVTNVTTVRSTSSEVTTECSRIKCIALTFDDGPGAETGRLLDILKAKRAHASFFVIGGGVRRNAALVKREATEGHTVGNHTLTHPSLTLVTDSVLRSEIATTNSLISQVTGVRPHFVRPPNGAVNAHVAGLFGEEGMAGVLWSIDTRDWADHNSDVIYNRVIAGARPGAIVVLHDIQPTSVDAVPRIIDKLQAQGYRFVSLDEMLGNVPAGKIYSSL